MGRKRNSPFEARTQAGFFNLTNRFLSASLAEVLYLQKEFSVKLTKIEEAIFARPEWQAVKDLSGAEKQQVLDQITDDMLN